MSTTVMYSQSPNEECFGGQQSPDNVGVPSWLT